MSTENGSSAAIKKLWILDPNEFGKSACNKIISVNPKIVYWQITNAPVHIMDPHYGLPHSSPWKTADIEPKRKANNWLVLRMKWLFLNLTYASLTTDRAKVRATGLTTAAATGNLLTSKLFVKHTTSLQNDSTFLESKQSRRINAVDMQRQIATIESLNLRLSISSSHAGGVCRTTEETTNVRRRTQEHKTEAKRRTEQTIE